MISFNRNRRRHSPRHTPAERAAAQQEALQRAKENISEGNYQTIIAGFVSCGIPQADIKPRENVFTYLAWQAQGRQVRKGEHGVKIITFIPCERKEKDPETGEEKKVPCKVERRATVFHISQTDPIGTPSPSPSPAPSPAPRPAGRERKTLRRIFSSRDLAQMAR